LTLVNKSPINDVTNTSAAKVSYRVKLAVTDGRGHTGDEPAPSLQLYLLGTNATRVVEHAKRSPLVVRRHSTEITDYPQRSSSR
jgi:hypothetical protein